MHKLERDGWSAQRWQFAARVMLVGLLSVGLSGCGDGSGKPTALAGVTHPWINPPHSVDPKAVVLSPFLVYRVHPDAMKEALTELEHEPYIQISPNMAAHYTKADVRVPAEMRPFLIRGLDTGSSEISVVQSMLGLWVKVVGGDHAHLDYQPLVVLIDPTPTEIYVTVEPKG